MSDSYTVPVRGVALTPVRAASDHDVFARPDGPPHSHPVREDAAGDRGDGGEFHAEWVAALNRLEADVIVAEQALRRPPAEQPDADTVEPWREPDLGPIPAELVETARIILERQQAVMAALRTSVSNNVHRQALAGRLVENNPQPPRGPIYLDIEA